MGSIPESRRSPGGGHGNPLQCSCLDRGACPWAAVHGVAKSRTRLKRLSSSSSSIIFACLENPRDGRAWCAAVYGVAQSQTLLKRLSSSSSIIFDHRKQEIATPTTTFLMVVKILIPPHFDLSCVRCSGLDRY